MAMLPASEEASTHQPRYALFIDGRWMEAASGRRYQSMDPFLGEPWAGVADGDAEDVNAASGIRSASLAGRPRPARDPERIAATSHS
jgi:acyl-CoA reductase-like NAD-dependent aldehyde dehydrogenase